MLRKPLKIIGVNPGTRYIGIAVFQGAEIRDWAVKVIEGKWSKEKMRKIMKIFSSLIGQYELDVLAIKKIHPSRSSPNLNQLVNKIKEFAKRKGLKVYQYSIKDLENFFSPEDLPAPRASACACPHADRSRQTGRINKKKLAEIIASEYPFLAHELEKEKSRKNPYHIRMFEAVALGSICFHQLNKH